MKESSRIRASHVNSGTSRAGKKLGRKEVRGRELRHPKLNVEIEKSDTTPYGGLSLAASLMKSLDVPQRLDHALDILEARRPYSESDHVLTHVYNLFLGGSCIEDIALLQASEPARRILGARAIPDPTTAGDFLRRFDANAIEALNAAIDQTQSQVWERKYGTGKRATAYVDLDSHVKHVYGNQKEGADFTYKGGYGYHPLAITLAESQEVLRLLNRWGNVTSADGAAVELEKVFPLLEKHFTTIIVRGDSAFVDRDIFELCDERGQYFAIVCPQYPNLQKIADSLPESAWEPFDDETRRTMPRQRQRQRGKNLRRQNARARKKRDLKLQRQWVAEVPYELAKSEQEYRLVIRRQKIEESKQGQLFTLWRYRFAITNLPCGYSSERVMRITYRRCDQENIIEQLQNGVSAMRMPTGSFAGNAAFLVCARLAFNLKSWLAMLALPLEVISWEWKRFRLAFVYLAARVIRSARRVVVRFAHAHRYAVTVLTGLTRLQV